MGHWEGFLKYHFEGAGRRFWSAVAGTRLSLLFSLRSITFGPRIYFTFIQDSFGASLALSFVYLSQAIRVCLFLLGGNGAFPVGVITFFPFDQHI